MYLRDSQSFVALVELPPRDEDSSEASDGSEAPQLTGDLADLFHGDLVYYADSYRATGTFVVVDGRAEPVCGQAEPMYGDGERGTITRAISAAIEDPVAFYWAAFDHYQGISEIEMCPTAHEALLRRAAGGRAVDPTRKVWWNAGEGAYQILSPASPDIPTELCPETPDEYLTAVDYLAVDPLTARERAANKEIYEIRAHAHFLALARGSHIFICGPPDARGGWGASLRFVAAVPDAAVPGRVAAVRAANHTGAQTEFRPRVVAQTGPLGGVAVWATDGPQPCAGFATPLLQLIDLSDLGEGIPSLPWERRGAPF